MVLRGRRRRDRIFTRASSRRPRFVGLLVVIGALLGWLAVRGGGSGGPLEPLPSDPGLVHVHGLGINPADGVLYAATHMGLFRVPQDGKAQRIANRYQDTMGFTVVGADRFLASGHPDLREKLPPLLGLIETRDAGRTWAGKSLQGKADFHVLEYQAGWLYGYNSSQGALMASRDMTSWETRSRLQLSDFAVDPRDAGYLLAATPSGLQRSQDGGRRWDTISDAGAAHLLLIEWADGSEPIGATTRGELVSSPDRGLTWRTVGELGGEPDALLATPGRLHASVGDRGLLTSADGGRSWQPFSSRTR